MSSTLSQIFTVANQKGGVGKTTVTAVIARAASNAGRRVLVVELDGKHPREYANVVSYKKLVSIDPDSDTPEKLAELVARHRVDPARWTFATRRSTSSSWAWANRCTTTMR